MERSREAASQQDAVTPSTYSDTLASVTANDMLCVHDAGGQGSDWPDNGLQHKVSQPLPGGDV